MFLEQNTKYPNMAKLGIRGAPSPKDQTPHQLKHSVQPSEQCRNLHDVDETVGRDFFDPDRMLSLLSEESDCWRVSNEAFELKFVALSHRFAKVCIIEALLTLFSY